MKKLFTLTLIAMIMLVLLTACGDAHVRGLRSEVRYGSANAASELSDIYRNGTHGVKASKRMQLKYAELAAERGNKEGLIQIGHYCLDEGDPHAAITMYMIAAEKGEPRGLMEIAKLYSKRPLGPDLRGVIPHYYAAFILGAPGAYDEYKKAATYVDESTLSLYISIADDIIEKIEFATR